MRICMVGYTFYETDSRVQQYTKALIERGDQVDFIGLGMEGQPTEGLVEGVRVFRIQGREYNERGKISYLSKLLRFLAGSSVLLSKKHLRDRYDLIHVHSVPDFLVFAAWLPKLSGAKVILDIHDVVPELYATKFNTPPGSLLFRLLLLMEKLCAAFADHVIIANDIWREKLISRSVKGSKCTTILNYPRDVVLQGRRERNANPKFIILYPGTLNHHQGVDIAIRAVALLKDKIPGLEFHIYGGGAEFEHMALLIRELGLEKYIILRPYVPHEEILRIMEDADLGVDPKRTDGFANEAFGTKIFEFMALGVPTVVSDTLTNKYYFNDDVVRFFHGGDVDDLARSVLAVYENKEATSRQVEVASQFVRAFEWNARISTYLELVDSLTRSPRKMSTQKSRTVL